MYMWQKVQGISKWFLETVNIARNVPGKEEFD